jgi:hypothetical protein
MKQGAIGFITVKRGIGEEVRHEDEARKSKGRLFVYWQNNSFKEVLDEAGFTVLREHDRPYNEHTYNLTYFVQVK